MIKYYSYYSDKITQGNDGVFRHNPATNRLSIDTEPTGNRYWFRDSDYWKKKIKANLSVYEFEMTTYFRPLLAPFVSPGLITNDHLL